MSDAKKNLLNALGPEYVYSGRYFECRQEITGEDLANLIDKLIRQRIDEVLKEGKP